MNSRSVYFVLLAALLLIIIGTQPQEFLTQVKGETYYLRVRLDYAILNNRVLSIDNPEIEVAPGEIIMGSVTFTVENVQPGSWITPVIWVTSWERGSVADGKVRVVAQDIRTTRQFMVSIYVRAPETPGVYYIGFFAWFMYDPDEVASSDHPALYGNGNDVWDMSQSDWEYLIVNGRPPQGSPYCWYYCPVGRAIRVLVSAAPGITPTPIISTAAPVATVTVTVVSPVMVAAPATTITIAPIAGEPFATITSIITETVTATVAGTSWDFLWFLPLAIILIAVFAVAAQMVRSSK